MTPCPWYLTAVSVQSGVGTGFSDISKATLGSFLVEISPAEWDGQEDKADRETGRENGGDQLLTGVFDVEAGAGCWLCPPSPDPRATLSPEK